MSDLPVRVLLVEDELALASTLRMSLKKMGYECSWAKSLSEARKQIGTFFPSLVVLDRNLPDGDGLELLNESAFQQMKVLVLSARSATEDKIKGLNHGADDYLPKPFHWDELKARIAALLRKKVVMNVPAPETLWSRKPDSLQLKTHQGWIELTPLEYKFLSYLMDREGTIISKDRLLREVWGFSLLPKTRTVDYVLTQLRKQIEPEPDQPKHLITVRGAGVKFQS